MLLIIVYVRKPMSVDRTLPYLYIELRNNLGLYHVYHRQSIPAHIELKIFLDVA